MIENKELSELVKTTIEGIETGLQKTGYGITGDIEFNVAVVNMEKVGGGIKLFVVRLAGDQGKENVTKIKFKVCKNRSGPQVSFG